MVPHAVVTNPHIELDCCGCCEPHLALFTAIDILRRGFAPTFAAPGRWYVDADVWTMLTHEFWEELGDVQIIGAWDARVEAEIRGWTIAKAPVCLIGKENMAVAGQTGIDPEGLPIVHVNRIAWAKPKSTAFMVGGHVVFAI